MEQYQAVVDEHMLLSHCYNNLFRALRLLEHRVIRFDPRKSSYVRRLAARFCMNLIILSGNLDSILCERIPMHLDGEFFTMTGYDVGRLYYSVEAPPPSHLSNAEIFENAFTAIHELKNAWVETHYHNQNAIKINRHISLIESTIAKIQMHVPVLEPLPMRTRN